MDMTQTVRAAQMDLLNELDRICKKHNIPYFLAEGTLLGAIRHQGFIPWDDDVDVAILRQHAAALRAACDRELDDAYELVDWHTDPYSPLPYMKLKIKGTHYREEIMGNTKANDGLFIDIFFFDNVPNNPTARKRQKLYAGILLKILLVRCGYRLGDSGLKRAAFGLLKLCSYIRSINSWRRSFEKLEQKYNNDPAEYMDIVHSKEENRHIKANLLTDLVAHPFEDGMYPVPRDADAVLKQIYGNYMQLPPEEQRIGTHCIQHFDMGDYQTRYTGRA